VIFSEFEVMEAMENSFLVKIWKMEKMDLFILLQNNGLGQDYFLDD